MERLSAPVKKHYSREGLYETILQRLQEQGIDKITRKDIAAVDEFHVRGAEVSFELASAAGFDQHTKLLDVGCGIGGPCRMLADKYGCKVTGIDITDEFIRTAQLLSELLNLQHLSTFIQGDALHLPFEDNSFDVVWTQHVQMNIENKNTFYSEIHRVLKAGGRFIYYDIFKNNNDPLHFPVPWANDVSLSFLFTKEDLGKKLSGLGFTKIETKDQTNEAINFFSKLFDKIAKEGAPKVGLYLIMGEGTPVKMGNLLKNIMEGKLELESGMYEKN
ncbi:MAG: class I SAM-dependent methyltransferase [Ginsengibacter sp.]